MDLVKWEPFRDLAEFRSRMDNLFDSFFGKERAGRWCPDIDVTETPEELLVKADIPGIDKKDLSVIASGDNLIIKGERKEEKEEKTKHMHRIERRCGSFERIIPIPVIVEATKITADYKDGVLVVHLPKKPEAKPKEIPIKIQ
jgi:HSP20 family protein